MGGGGVSLKLYYNEYLSSIQASNEYHNTRFLGEIRKISIHLEKKQQKNYEIIYLVVELTNMSIFFPVYCPLNHIYLCKPV